MFIYDFYSTNAFEKSDHKVLNYSPNSIGTTEESWGKIFKCVPNVNKGKGFLFCLILLYHQSLNLKYVFKLINLKLVNGLENLSFPATAKLLQSCPTLCNPIDGSPPGSPVPGILQARTLEWVAISFSNA